MIKVKKQCDKGEETFLVIIKKLLQKSILKLAFSKVKSLLGVKYLSLYVLCSTLNLV